MRSSFQVPHALRLTRMLEWLRQQDGHLQINGATWLARHRRHQERAPVGCVLGHYVHEARPGPISLVPITWTSQLKAPILQTELLAELPHIEWQHYTLHYQSDHIEGWGLVAAGIFLRLKPQLIHHLFMPQGYERRMPIESLTLHLGTITGVDACTQSSLPYSEPC